MVSSCLLFGEYSTLSTPPGWASSDSQSRLPPRRDVPDRDRPVLARGRHPGPAGAEGDGGHRRAMAAKDEQLPSGQHVPDARRPVGAAGDRACRRRGRTRARAPRPVWSSKVVTARPLGDVEDLGVAEPVGRPEILAVRAVGDRRGSPRSGARLAKTSLAGRGVPDPRHRARVMRPAVAGGDAACRPGSTRRRTADARCGSSAARAGCGRSRATGSRHRRRRRAPFPRG